MKILKKLCAVALLLVCFTGCTIKRDNMEGIDIYTTVYPIEYVTDYLYGYNSNVKSIYPAGVDASNYNLTEKQIDEYSKGSIFVYNHLNNEKYIARDLQNKNTELRLIAASEGLEGEDKIEELWLNPKNYLMLAHNIKNGLEEYITSVFVKNEIEKNYESLKVLISGFDADLVQTVENAVDKNIIVASDALTFLDEYRFDIINLDVPSVANSTVRKCRELITNKKVKYIFILDDQEESAVVKELVSLGAELVRVKSMTIRSEEDKASNTTYKQMMKDLIEYVRKEVYV